MEEVDQNFLINDYIRVHPLNDLIRKQTWNNIPLPIRELFELITDALIGQDIHTWERKSLINERFFKMQHLASRLNERIKEVQGKMSRWIEDTMKRTYEHSRRIELEGINKHTELSSRVDSNHETLLTVIDRMKTDLNRNKKQAHEDNKMMASRMKQMRQEFKSMMTRQRQEMAKKFELVLADNTVHVDEQDQAVDMNLDTPALRR